MKHALLLTSLLLSSPSFSQEEARHQGYAPLEELVGSWTIAGKEGTYLEICDWYDGKRHVICNTESKRQDGSTSRGMSILSFVPEQGYVYTGIGNRGRYETYRGGTYNNGIIEYLDHTDGMHTRIRIGPFSDKNRVPFNVHTSQDGTKWEQADSFNYVRVK
jgi:hypothetical protein